MGKNQHVVPDKNGGWNVKGAGNSKATKHFDTKQPATDYARKISQNQGSELIIHNKDGRIAQKDSHGKDSTSTKRIISYLTL
ncbi:DUF2188 domain-containing protein [Veillonella atypica]|nr:DUF2188 domain-containing protein [Veillonella atypica]